MTIKFQPGQVVATPGALEAIREAGQQPIEFLGRHLAGDWGNLDEEDSRLNEQALIEGSRLLSAYSTAGGVRLYVITEAADDDGRRAATTLLRTDEY
jgi:hypothetical protein